jgi:hypothetical protein
VKGLIESAVNVVRSYPGFPDALGRGVDRRRPTRPAFRYQSDSIKDSKQQELIEKGSRWVESQILQLQVNPFILRTKRTGLAPSGLKKDTTNLDDSSQLDTTIDRLVPKHAVFAVSLKKRNLSSILAGTTSYLTRATFAGLPPQVFLCLAGIVAEKGGPRSAWLRTVRRLT